MEGFFEHPTARFFQVPNEVEDLPEDVLCVHAFRVLCHVARTKPGTFFDVDRLCARFAIGYDGKVWRRVSKQLRALGALSSVEVRSETGQLKTVLRFCWPVVSEETGRAKGTAGTGRAKGTEPSVQKERTILRLKTPARRAAAVAAKRRTAPGASVASVVIVEAEAKPVSADKAEPVSSGEAEPVEAVKPGLVGAGEALPAPEPLAAGVGVGRRSREALTFLGDAGVRWREAERRAEASLSAGCGDLALLRQVVAAHP